MKIESYWLAHYLFTSHTKHKQNIQDSSGKMTTHTHAVKPHYANMIDGCVVAKPRAVKVYGRRYVAELERLAKTFPVPQYSPPKYDDTFDLKEIVIIPTKSQCTTCFPETAKQCDDGWNDVYDILKAIGTVIFLESDA